MAVTSVVCPEVSPTKKLMYRNKAARPCEDVAHYSDSSDVVKVSQSDFHGGVQCAVVLAKPT